MATARRARANAGVTYGDFYRTGIQDCQNTISIDEFDFDSGGTTPEIVKRTMDGWMPDLKEHWLEQNEDTIEDLDPDKAFDEWRAGYASCAGLAVEAERARRLRDTEQWYLAQDGTSDETIERFDTFDEALAELARVGRGVVREGHLNGPTRYVAARVVETGAKEGPKRLELQIFDHVYLNQEKRGEVRRPAVTQHNPPRMYRPQKVVATLQKETRPSFRRGTVISEPDELMHTLVPYMGARATELFLVIYVNVRNEIVGYNEYSSGSVASVVVDGSGLFRDALTSGAAAVITVHQHPTGVATPSNDDLELWKRLDAAGDIVGIPVLDNLVLGEDTYYSQRMGGKRKIPASAVAEARDA